MSEFSFIESKIEAIKTTSPFLRNKANSFVFSALCVKALFYKNPALRLNDDILEEIIVDGPYDGGVDILLSDPSSEDSDIILGQSKYNEEVIREQEVLDALMKMWLFYKDMCSGHYEQVNETVQRRFFTLQSDVSNDAKIHFVFYTSAPKNRISVDRVKRKFAEQISDECPNHIVDVLFCSDIVEEIKEAESRRPSVEYGVLKIDCANNVLEFGEDAVIVNVSAYSIKRLYAEHSSSLLAKNLRYYIKSRDIDKGINQTIDTSPDDFWYRNNGITIICDDFSIDGKEAKLKNFSVINGGQTTYLLYRSANINETRDLFVQCKIIRSQGDDAAQKSKFSLEIAKATNSQKPIKKLDLKANAPEQLSFAQAMRDVGIFYQTKRGETIPSEYKEWFKNTDMVEVGKLGLCAVLQMPCASRSKPSSMYEDKYYNIIFNRNQQQMANISKELLYIDYFYRFSFIKEFDRLNDSEPDREVRIPFAHNARTICIAFVAFAARYHNANINDSVIELIKRAATASSDDGVLYDVFRDLGSMSRLFPKELFDNKDAFDKILTKLFNAIIDEGVRTFSITSRYDSSITATNFLKKDRNYYTIISDYWRELRSIIDAVFSEIDC